MLPYVLIKIRIGRFFCKFYEIFIKSCKFYIKKRKLKKNYFCTVSNNEVITFYIFLSKICIHLQFVIKKLEIGDFYIKFS